MRPIDQENDPKVLRQYALMLEGTVADMGKKIDRLEAALEGRKELWLDERMRDQLHRLQRKFFGFGREKAKKSSQRQVGHDKQQLNAHTDRLFEEKGEKSAKSEASAGGESPLVKEHDFTEKELQEESRLRDVIEDLVAWKPMSGFYEESSEITVTERVYRKVIHRRKKYRLKDEYNKTGKEVIITAPGPAKLKAGCKYSIDFAVAAVIDKYEYHLPLERQRRKMEAAGLKIDVKTLYRLCETVADRVGDVKDAIRRDILDEFSAVHLDETPWRINGGGQSGYMWVLSNRRGCYYQFEPTRSSQIPTEMLKGYSGSIVTDGYSGYNAVRGDPKIRVGNCWSHARREFFERLDDYPSQCEVALDYIDKLFELEAEAKNLDDLKTIRRKRSKPLVDDFREWCLETRAKFLSEEGISAAIDYCMRRWDELKIFLDDVSIPMSNNDAERALRHAVVGRKNYAGSKTINGADTAATLFTVIETCKRVGIQPTEYLTYVVTERWRGREPEAPIAYAEEKFGAKAKSLVPSDGTWKI